MIHEDIYRKQHMDIRQTRRMNVGLISQLKGIRTCLKAYCLYL